MNYKGVEIEDDREVLTEELPFKEFCSNYVEMDIEDLEELVQAYRDKEKELKEKGVDFSGLSVIFHGTSFYMNPNGPDEDASAEFYFSYYRPETTSEKDERILRKMEWIDKEIEDKKQEEVYKRTIEICEINKAKKLLEENGYSVELESSKKKKKK